MSLSTAVLRKIQHTCTYTKFTWSNITKVVFIRLNFFLFYKKSLIIKSLDYVPGQVLPLCRFPMLIKVMLMVMELVTSVIIVLTPTILIRNLQLQYLISNHEEWPNVTSLGKIYFWKSFSDCIGLIFWSILLITGSLYFSF